MDVIYFLFNPPNASEHPSDTAWKTQYANWFADIRITNEELNSKIIEVSNTLTLWETGATQLTNEQLGHLRVFHPLFPNSNWNHPTKCQQAVIINQSEPFCRWTTLVQVGMNDIKTFNSYEGSAVANATLEFIRVYQGQGNSYAETFALILGRFRSASTASPTATTASAIPRTTATPISLSGCSSALECINTGHDYSQSGDYSKSLQYLTEAIRIDPNYAAAYYARGLAYNNLGEYEKAIEDYTEAIRIDPNYAAAYFIRGLTSEKVRSFGELEDYTEAIRLDPNYADAYYARGIRYADVGYSRILNDSCIGDDVTLSSACILYENYKIAYGYYEKAIEDYTEVIRIDPNYADAYTNRGFAYYIRGQYEKAVQDYDQAVWLDPGNEVYIQNRDYVISKLN